jgi:hypothetical protein
MVSVTVGGWESVVGGEVNQSPRFSAFLIGFSRRVCGGTVGTVNVGSRAAVWPPFIIVLRERGSTAIQGKRPQSGRESDWFPIRRSHS